MLTTLKASPADTAARSEKHGFTLAQLAGLSDKAKLKYTLNVGAKWNHSWMAFIQVQG